MADGEESWQPLGEVIPIVPKAIFGAGFGLQVRSRRIQVVRERGADGHAAWQIYRATGLGYVIVGGVVVAAGLLGALASDSSSQRAFGFLLGFLGGPVLVGLGIVVHAVAEVLRAVRHTRVDIPRPGEPREP